MRVGKVVIVSGPSGAGKGTLVKNVMDQARAVWLSVSATTRPPRPGEREGIDYIFLTDAQFDQLLAEDGFLEWAQVHGQRYGTPRRPVEEAVARGEVALLEIDPQGAMQVKERVPDAVLVFIKPPSFDELRKRLEGRGSETKEQVERRLQTAKVELEFAGVYDFVVINDDVRQASNELAAIIGDISAHTSHDEKD